jgi:hypothetical protein
MKTTKKHISENTRLYKKYPHIHPQYKYWYQHDNNIAFELSWDVSIVTKYNDIDNICILIGEATSKKQFVDVVYDYLKLKNTQP